VAAGSACHRPRPCLQKLLVSHHPGYFRNTKQFFSSTRGLIEVRYKSYHKKERWSAGVSAGM